MNPQLDILFLVEGVASLLLAVSCFPLAGRVRLDRLPWRAMLLFSVGGAVFMWLEMASRVIFVSPGWQLLRTGFLLVALLGLFEFGRRGLATLGARHHSPWLLVPLLVLSLSGGWVSGWAGVQAGLRLALGIPGALGTVAVLFRAPGDAGRQRRSLQGLALGVLLFALATGALIERDLFGGAG